MKLSFYGAAQQVTGSNYLLEVNGNKILVDCGLFQGSRYAETLNYANFPFSPKEIDYVFLTHSHADHSGRIPKLYKDGFRGKIFATKPTIDLSIIALDDNIELIKEEARKDGHDPLFSSSDLHQVFLLAHGVDYQDEIDLRHGVRAVFYDAGHILGSAIIEISWKDEEGKIRSIYFSGDLGNYPVPLLKHYDMPNGADYIVVESTYGDRLHGDNSKKKEDLRRAIKTTVERGGTVIVPTFAIERTQELLYELNELIEGNQLPRVPVFLDSPLAIKLTKVYKNYENYFNKNVVRDIRTGDDIFNFPGLRMTFSSEESREINKINGPKIIIAGSGMSLGGRIIYHEQRYLSDPKSLILFVGYQVKGSPGRQILDGNKEVRLLGRNISINCTVEMIEGYSAHADQGMLVEWVGKAKQDGNLKKVFVTHGEYNSSIVLGQKLEDELGVECSVPGSGDSFELA